jgi:hypothetical protein
MERCILYYPHIYDISGEWLRQTLLYWDEIGSIVPITFEAQNPYSPDLAFLKSEGVFRPFRTEAILEDEKFEEFNQEIKSFQNELKDIILSGEFQRKVGAESERVFEMDIYSQKVSMSTFFFLEENGLAKKKKGRGTQRDEFWFSFEKNTGLLYMSLLAKYLAAMDTEASTTCGTDSRDYQDLNFAARKKPEGKTSGDAIAGINLKFLKMIPVPTANVSLQDILEFKRTRRAELLRFRKVLLDTQKNLSECDSLSQANDILATFGEQKELELSELKRLLGEAKISAVAGTLEVISKAKASDWITGLLTSGASLVASLGIGLGKYAIDKKNEQSALLSKSAFSYLYSAEKAGLLNK